MQSIHAGLKVSVLAIAAAFSLNITPADAAKVRVTITNLAPAGGTYLTPVWVAFHNGNFDTYNRGEAVSPAFERLAEDGDTGPLSMAFSGVVGPAAGMGQDATLLEPDGFPGMPIFDPGNSSTKVFDVNPTSESYFSFASMVIPSNDAFIGNDNPQAYNVFDEDGNVRSFDIYVNGDQVLDAGSEQNTEVDAAFLNQAAGDAGVVENGVVMRHSGFNGSVANPDGTPVNILGGSNGAGVMFDAVAADFSREGSKIARIHIGPLVDGSFSGGWYDPARNGEGLMIEVFPRDGAMKGVVTYFTYLPDGSGQAWIQGMGTFVDDSLVIPDMYLTSGPSFGQNFDAAALATQPWGSLSVKFNSCSTGEFSYSSSLPAYASGSHPLTKLTPSEIPGAGACP